MGIVHDAAMPELAGIPAMAGPLILPGAMPHLLCAIDSCDKRMQKKREEIKQSIMGMLSQTDVFELKICLENIRTLAEQMGQVDERIMSRVD